MSYPENPLAKYRTYQYHHVLVACQGTKIAEYLSSSKGTKILDTFLRSRQARPTTEGGLYAPPTDTESKSAIDLTGEKFVVLIDGRFDADFIIESASWELILNPTSGAQASQGFTTMAVEGSLTVVEPRGLDFMNQMARVADSLQKDYSTIVYLLKTYFVGYESNTFDQTAPTYITRIRPMLFGVYNVAASFDFSGATYKIDFFGINNGAAKLPQVLKGADMINVKVNKNSTLTTVMERLTSRLNCLAQHQYDEINEVALKSGIRGFGVLVNYKIVLDDVYGDDYKLDTLPSIVESVGTKDPVLHFGKTVTIESAIDIIMQSCSRVSKDAQGNGEKRLDGGDKKYLYKIISTIQTSNDVYTVYYIIRRYEVPTSLFEKATKSDPAKFKTNYADKGLGMMLDYYYTGKNVDILEFDMSMENGLFFMQTLASSNTIVDTASGSELGEPEQSTDKHQSSTPITPKALIKRNTPIFINTKIDDIFIKNTKNTKSRMGFKELLSKFAGLEAIEAKIKILGNPALMDNVSALPSELIQFKKHTSSLGPIHDVMTSWDTVPGFLKINIKMPVVEQKYGTNTETYQPFWYDGLYYIFAIKTEFSNGDFTQTLDIMSLLTDSTFPDADTSNDEEKSAQTEADKKSTTENAAPSKRTDNQKKCPSIDDIKITTTPQPDAGQESWTTNSGLNNDEQFYLDALAKHNIKHN